LKETDRIQKEQKLRSLGASLGLDPRLAQTEVQKAIDEAGGEAAISGQQQVDATTRRAALEKEMQSAASEANPERYGAPSVAPVPAQQIPPVVPSGQKPIFSGTGQPIAATGARGYSSFGNGSSTNTPGGPAMIDGKAITPLSQLGRSVNGIALAPDEELDPTTGQKRKKRSIAPQNPLPFA
jgi:hypothetical protein